MRRGVIRLPEPLIDCDLCPPCRCKPSGAEHLAAKRPIEALVLAVVPWRARIDSKGRDADAPQQIATHRHMAPTWPNARASTLQFLIADEASDQLRSLETTPNDLSSLKSYCPSAQTTSSTSKATAPLVSRSISPP